MSFILWLSPIFCWLFWISLQLSLNSSIAPILNTKFRHFIFHLSKVNFFFFLYSPNFRIWHSSIQEFQHFFYLYSRVTPILWFGPSKFWIKLFFSRNLWQSKKKICFFIFFDLLGRHWKLLWHCHRKFKFLFVFRRSYYYDKYKLNDE